MFECVLFKIPTIKGTTKADLRVSACKSCSSYLTNFQSVIKIFTLNLVSLEDLFSWRGHIDMVTLLYSYCVLLSFLLVLLLVEFEVDLLFGSSWSSCSLVQLLLLQVFWKSYRIGSVQWFSSSGVSSFSLSGIPISHCFNYA